MNVAYRKDIDGLRGVAVSLVVLFHVFPKWLPGGFVGVDLFFVISGYLITGLILKDKDANGFSYLNFYLRRVRRLYPALLTVLLFTFIAGWLVYLPDEFEALSAHVLASLVYINNLLLWSESGYFDRDAIYKPLLHLWSLAVEEQFYLVWPTFLLITARIFRMAETKIVFLSIIGLVVLSEICCRYSPSLAYYFPLSRFWELLAGGWLACRERIRTYQTKALTSSEGVTKLHANIIFVAAIIVLGFSLVTLNKDSRFPGFSAIPIVISGILFLVSGQRSSMSASLLSSRLLVFLGQISYPLYLWHWPVLSFTWTINGGLPSPQLKLFVILLSVLLAYSTYRFVEQPIRMRAPLFSACATLAKASVIVCIFGALGFFDFINSRIHSLEAERIITAARDTGFPGGLIKVRRDRYVDYVNFANGTEDVVVFGDSHAQHYAPRVSFIGDLKKVRFVTLQGCPPIPGIREDLAAPGCASFVDDSISFILSSNVNTVVLAACWNCYFLQQTRISENSDISSKVSTHYFAITEAGDVSFRKGEGAQIARDRLIRLIERLRNANKRVFLVLDNPYSDALDPKSYIAGMRLSNLKSVSPPEDLPADASEVKLAVNLNNLAIFAGATVIDPRERLCPSGGNCLVLSKTQDFIYSDRNHLRATWVYKYADFIDPVFISSLKTE